MVRHPEKLPFGGQGPMPWTVLEIFPDAAGDIPSFPVTAPPGIFFDMAVARAKMLDTET